MEHVVFYPSPEGSPAFQRVGSLEDAINFVEHLRNTADVRDFTVHELTPVPLAVKAYYKIEVPGAAAAEAAVVEAAPVEAAPVEAPVADTVEAVAVDGGEDRSEEWVAAAAVIEPPAVAPAAEVAPVPPFAEAAEIDAEVPAVPEQVAEAAPAEGVEHGGLDLPSDAVGSQDVIPVPSGRRSMGFFSR